MNFEFRDSTDEEHGTYCVWVDGKYVGELYREAGYENGHPAYHPRADMCEWLDGFPRAIDYWRNATDDDISLPFWVGMIAVAVESRELTTRFLDEYKKKAGWSSEEMSKEIK